MQEGNEKIKAFIARQKKAAFIDVYHAMLNEDGTINPMAQMMVTMLAEFSRAERSAIQQRLASGYKKHLAAGGKVGRKKGEGMTSAELVEKHKDIVKYLNKGRSIRETATLVGKSTRTVLKIKKLAA